MAVQYHIVAIDNDFGHISDVIIQSSYKTKKEAEHALQIIKLACQKSHVDKSSREKENYQRYIDWAADAIIECPGKYGGLNWSVSPGQLHHSSHVKSVPYHMIRNCGGLSTIQYSAILIKGTKPLALLEELTIPPEHYLEYHLAF